MEFIVNKIDTDVRKKIEEETEKNKVHSGKSINVKRDLKDSREEDINGKQTLFKEADEKKYITIDGIKYNNDTIDIKAQKVEDINVENSKGRNLDTMK